MRTLNANKTDTVTQTASDAAEEIVIADIINRRIAWPTTSRLKNRAAHNESKTVQYRNITFSRESLAVDFRIHHIRTEVGAAELIVLVRNPIHLGIAVREGAAKADEADLGVFEFAQHALLPMGFVDENVVVEMRQDGIAMVSGAPPPFVIGRQHAGGTVLDEQRSSPTPGQHRLGKTVGTIMRGDHGEFHFTSVISGNHFARRNSCRRNSAIAPDCKPAMVSSAGRPLSMEWSTSSRVAVRPSEYHSTRSGSPMVISAPPRPSFQIS